MNSTIKRDLFFARAYYFAYMGGWGFVLPFINLFYVSLGLSGTQIGSINSVSAVVGLILSPIVVTEVKKLPKARLLLQCFLLLGAIGYFLLGRQVAFVGILIVVFFHAVITAGIMPTSDAMAVAVAQKADTGYGSVRMWASLGWIGTVLVSGALIERFGFLISFDGVSLMWLAGAGLLQFIEPQYFVVRADARFAQPSIKTAFSRILHDRTLLGFAIAVIFIGFLNSGVLQFEYVYLAELGASKQVISVAGILSAIVELPFMIYADRFVRRVGARRVMLLALGMIFFQRAAVLIWPSIATIMIVRFLGGISFSFYTISYIGIISSRTDSGETGTVLALFTVTLAGLVNMLAAPVSGAIFDAIGARWLYALAMAGYALGLLILWIARPRESLETERLPAA